MSKSEQAQVFVYISTNTKDLYSNEVPLEYKAVHL
jgi:hypothetical protein